MAYYNIKNMKLDMVDGTVAVCMCCEDGVKPIQLNVNFPLHITASQSESELKDAAREKLRYVLNKALESLE